MAIGRILAAACVAAMALTVASCRPSEPLKVDTIQVGRSANSDGSVGNHTTRFRPDDTMHAAVITSGRGAGRITVKWSYQGRAVSEESKDVSFFESGSTEFHIKLPGGFPPGDYRVEVLIDGKPVGERTMRVDKG